MEQDEHSLVEGSDSIQIDHESEKEQVVARVYVVVHVQAFVTVALSELEHVVVDLVPPHSQRMSADFELEDY